MKTIAVKIKSLKNVGHFPKDQFKGELVKSWKVKLKELELDQVTGGTMVARGTRGNQGY